MVVIIDLEEGKSRMLSIGDSSYEESSVSSVDAIASAVLARKPELILVNPGGAISGSDLVRELNRLGGFQPGYARSTVYR